MPPTTITSFPFSHVSRETSSKTLAELLDRAICAHQPCAALAALLEAARLPRGSVFVERENAWHAESADAEIVEAEGTLLLLEKARCLVRVALTDAQAARLTSDLSQPDSYAALSDAAHTAPSLKPATDDLPPVWVPEPTSRDATFTVNVKTLTGSTVQILAWDSLPVEYFQIRLAHHLRCPVKDCRRLVYAGKQLDPARTLSDYCIPPGAMLQHVLRLRGGMLQQVSGHCDLGALGADAVVLLISKRVLLAGAGWEDYVTAASCADSSPHYVVALPLPLDVERRTVRTMLAALARLACSSQCQTRFAPRFALKALAPDAPSGDALLDVEMSALAVGRYRVPAFELSALD